MRRRGGAPSRRLATQLSAIATVPAGVGTGVPGAGRRLELRGGPCGSSAVAVLGRSAAADAVPGDRPSRLGNPRSGVAAHRAPFAPRRTRRRPRSPLLDCARSGVRLRTLRAGASSSGLGSAEGERASAPRTALRPRNVKLRAWAATRALSWVSAEVPDLRTPDVGAERPTRTSGLAHLDSRTTAPELGAPTRSARADPHGRDALSLRSRNSP